MAARVILLCNAPPQSQDAGFHTIFCPRKSSRNLIATLSVRLLETQTHSQNPFPALGAEGWPTRPFRYRVVNGSFINIASHHEAL